MAEYQPTPATWDELFRREAATYDNTPLPVPGSRLQPPFRRKTWTADYFPTASMVRDRRTTYLGVHAGRMLRAASLFLVSVDANLNRTPERRYVLNLRRGHETLRVTEDPRMLIEEFRFEDLRELLRSRETHAADSEGFDIVLSELERGQSGTYDIPPPGPPPHRE